MAAPTNTALVKKVLANSEPSNAKRWNVCFCAAVGVTADMAQTSFEDRY